MWYTLIYADVTEVLLIDLIWKHAVNQRACLNSDSPFSQLTQNTDLRAVEEKWKVFNTMFCASIKIPFITKNNIKMN